MDESAVDRYVDPGWRPTAEDYGLLGVVIHQATRIERAARDLAVLPLTWLTGTRLPFDELLVGSRGVRDARRVLKTVSNWTVPPPPWVEDALAWMREAEKAIEKRDELIHRDFVIASVATGDPTTSWSGPGLAQSRMTNEMVPLEDQYEHLAKEMRDVADRGGLLWVPAHQWVKDNAQHR